MTSEAPADTPAEVAAGRGWGTFKQTPAWVSFATTADPSKPRDAEKNPAITSRHKQLYEFLAMHVNRERGDAVVWPSRSSLAALLGYSRADKVDPLLKDLEQLRAIEIRHRRTDKGAPTSSLYVVHATPPPGYTGPATLTEWYKRRRDAAEERKGVAPKRGLPQGGPETGATPSPETGARVAPKRGPELEEEELHEGEPPTLATAEPAGAVVEPEGQEAEPPEETPDPDPAGDLVAAIEWPALWRLDAGTRRTLRELAGRCLQAGHAAAVVAAEAAAGIPGAAGPGATVRRLQALAESRPEPVDVAAGECTEREHLARTPHPFEQGRSRGYCVCGRYETNQVHTRRPTTANRPPPAESGERCPHDRRPGVCLDCRPASPTTATRPPAPRQPAEPEQTGLAALDQVLAEMAAARSVPTSTSDPAGAVASEPHLAPVAT